MGRTRGVTLLGIKSLFSLMALVLLIVVIHAEAHFVIAVIMKVPIASFSWFDPRYFAPVFIASSTEDTTGMMIVGYVGGLVTGVPLSAVLGMALY